MGVRSVFSLENGLDEKIFFIKVIKVNSLFECEYLPERNSQCTARKLRNASLCLKESMLSRHRIGCNSNFSVTTKVTGYRIV